MASLEILIQRADKAMRAAYTGHGAIWLTIFCFEGDEEQASERAMLEYCEKEGIDPDNNDLRFTCLINFESPDEFYLPGDPNTPEGWKPATDHQVHDPEYLKAVKATSQDELQATIDLGSSGEHSTH